MCIDLQWNMYQIGRRKKGKMERITRRNSALTVNGMKTLNSPLMLLHVVSGINPVTRLV
jgi:hypothetical protein